ncbi:MAG: M28 family peptidase [Bacteroidales bacterium]|nr:M28 family peptidase [Bacteroidales bacterium]
MKHLLRFVLILSVLYSVGCAPVPVKLDSYSNVAMEIADSISRFERRFSGTESLSASKDYISAYLTAAGGSVSVEPEAMDISSTDRVTLYNIVCKFYPDYRQRVLLFANYDQNPKSGDTTDCASGAALLMSLSHYIASHDPGVGVDIVLFDGRYAFNRTNGVNAHLRHCLGSQAWAARHKEETSDYQYGISVSHPATKGTVFAIDGNSNHFASKHFYFARSLAPLFGAEELFPDVIANPFYGDNTIVSVVAGVKSFNLAGTTISFPDTEDVQNDNLQDIDNQRFEIIAKIILETVYTNH